MTEQLPPSQLINRDTWQTEVAQRRNIGEVALSNLVEPLGIHNLDDPLQAYNALTDLLRWRDDNDEIAEHTAQHVAALEKDYADSHPISFDQESTDFSLEDAPKLVLSDPTVQEFIASRDLGEHHKNLVETWPTFVDTFTAGVHQGITLGYIPAVVESRLEDALQYTSVRAVDGAVMNTYGPGLLAYYRNDHDEVGLRPDPKNPDEDYIENAVHEFTHKLSGGTFTTEVDANESAIAIRPRVGYSTEIRPEELTRAGLNEAVTQHLTLGILTGDFETFDPDERSDGDDTYYNERKIVAALINKSQRQLDVKTVTNGFYEDTGPDGGVTARRKFVGDVVRAYGLGALGKLEKLCELSHMVDRDRLEEIVLSRIHSPQIDDNGNVMTKGSIDTDKLPSFDDLYPTAL